MLEKKQERGLSINMTPVLLASGPGFPCGDLFGVSETILRYLNDARTLKNPRPPYNSA
jgi:hypothetical protein